MTDTSRPSDHHDLNRWLDDTPGCSHRIHLNNAGAGLMPVPVINAVRDYLEKEARYGGYEAADAASGEIHSCYEAIGRLIGTTASNIAIVENATVAVSQVLSAFEFQRGDTIVTTNVVYSSNQIMLLNLVNRFGIKIIRAKDLPEGGVDPDSVRSLIEKHSPRLVMMSWVPTNSGLVQDARSVGEICREAEVPFVLDACQAVGQLPVDVKELKCDFLAATSRKFLRGPRGLGFLYVSDHMLEQGMLPMFPDTRGAKWTGVEEFRAESDAKRFENWEFPYALVLGLGAAARYLQSVGVETASRRALDLAAYTREKLAGLERVRVLDRGQNQCAIVTAAIRGMAAPEVVEKLRAKKINTSASMRHHGIIDMDAKGVETALRISPHYYNTREEIDRTTDVLKNVV
ncbi:Selenocysteine lyase/Cysteine desulfurase [Fodinibius roseus]|uniref:Selenocysteine lyase/Cysteine desulfurase n=1 Tax=Fodinibius roseus TaxID=1194090 RepID=A0A1M4YQP7_9BACT|nr:aminotransferase class V-fold PLP-dependent enzyme [Fodinibius roseus]SHF08125.1 Selenocysteine lyase/Cysteine desulfurase [Fodinibius roseus]